MAKIFTFEKSQIKVRCPGYLRKFFALNLKKETRNIPKYSYCRDNFDKFFV